MQTNSDIVNLLLQKWLVLILRKRDNFLWRLHENGVSWLSQRRWNGNKFCCFYSKYETIKYFCHYAKVPMACYRCSPRGCPLARACLEQMNTKQRNGKTT